MILGLGADPNLKLRIIEGEAMSFGKWFPHCETVGARFQFGANDFVANMPRFGCDPQVRQDMRQYMR
jgi:hypothetical protein